MSRRPDASRTEGRVRLALVLRLSLLGLLAGLSAVHLIAAVRANLLVVGPGLANQVGNRIGSDFPVFCAAARLAWHGRASGVYDVETLRGAYRDLVGAEVPAYPWTYPPTFFLILAPLAMLPPVSATWLWIGLTVAWLTAAVWRCVRWWVTPLLVIFFPAIAHAIVTGPTGTLTAALLASVAATLTSAPLMAGVFVALLAYKPHLAALLPLCLLAGRHGRVVALSAIAFGILVTASFVAFGPTPWLRFFENVPAHSGLLADERLPWERMPTVFVALRHATGSVRLAELGQAVATLCAVAACLLVWRRSADPASRWLALGAGAVLASPYAFDYDAALLVLPFAYLVREIAGRGMRGAVPVVIVLLWLTPVGFDLASQRVHQQLGVLPFVALLVYAVHRAARYQGGI